MKVGDTVRLKKGVVHTCPKGRRNFRTAEIRAELKDYADGAVFMDRDLRGCKYWNKEDLELV